MPAVLSRTAQGDSNLILGTTSPAVTVKLILSIHLIHSGWTFMIFSERSTGGIVLATLALESTVSIHLARSCKPRSLASLINSTPLMSLSHAAERTRIGAAMHSACDHS